MQVAAPHPGPHGPAGRRTCQCIDGPRDLQRWQAMGSRRAGKWDKSLSPFFFFLALPIGPWGCTVFWGSLLLGDPLLRVPGGNLLGPFNVPVFVLWLDAAVETSCPSVQTGASLQPWPPRPHLSCAGGAPAPPTLWTAAVGARLRWAVRTRMLPSAAISNFRVSFAPPAASCPQRKVHFRLCHGDNVLQDWVCRVILISWTVWSPVLKGI